MIRHDYRCSKCGETFEVAFDSSADFRRTVPCDCGGAASQVWLRAPGLAGVSEPGTRGVARSFEPGWDVQSGRYFNDRAARDKYIKKHGKELLGPKEWDRTMKAMPSRDPEPDRATLVEAMEKSYQELKAGEKPEEMPRFDETETITGVIP